MLIFPLVNDTSRKIIHIDMDAFVSQEGEVLSRLVTMKQGNMAFIQL